MHTSTFFFDQCNQSFQNRITEPFLSEMRISTEASLRAGVVNNALNTKNLWHFQNIFVTVASTVSTAYQKHSAYESLACVHLAYLYPFVALTTAPFLQP